MLRLPFVSIAAAAALTLAAVAGPVVSSADSASVTIHEGADATSWGYTPPSLTVQAGQAVTWTNAGALAHDANSTDGTWQTALLNTGQSASYTFNTPGTFMYICTPHPWMKGTIIVTAAASTVQTDAGTAAVAPTDAPSDAGAVAAPPAAPSDAGTAPVDAPAPADSGDGG